MFRKCGVAVVTCPTSIPLLFLSTSAFVSVSTPPSCSLNMTGIADSTSGRRSVHPCVGPPLVSTQLSDHKPMSILLG